MKRAHRFPRRLIQWISLSVCFALFLSVLAPFHFASSKESKTPTHARNSQGKKVQAVPPQPGPPAASLPNIEEARRRQHPEPEAKPNIPSLMRSRRRPLESRQERKVGDPLPPVVLPTPISLPTPTPLPRIGANIKSSRTSNLLAYNSAYLRISNDLLRYPAFRFLSQISNRPDDPSFDFLLVPMPQSGSSKVAFTSTRDGFMQIYVMNAEGSGQARLTSDGSNDDNPRWSPDGSKILFQSDRDNPGTNDIYLMNADGSGQTRLTTDANDDSAAVWSGNGSKIAFQSLRNSSFYQIYVMNAVGTAQVNISNSSASDSQPSWSPDGTKIAFASDRDNQGY